MNFDTTERAYVDPYTYGEVLQHGLDRTVVEELDLCTTVKQKMHAKPMMDNRDEEHQLKDRRRGYNEDNTSARSTARLASVAGSMLSSSLSSPKNYFNSTGTLKQ